MKILFQKLEDKDQKAKTEGKRRIIWDLYEKLCYKNTGSAVNPLQSMMSRNLNKYLKLFGRIKLKMQHELEDYQEPAKFMNNLDDYNKMNQVNRIMILGSYK